MRGSIKSEILENIPMGILLVPFVAMKYAGDYHIAALVFGLAFFVVYAAVIYGYAGDAGAGSGGRFKLQNYGSSIATSGYRLVDMCVDTGRIGRTFLVIYIVRFLVRAGFAGYVVTLLISGKGTISFWLAAVSFILMAVYGSYGDFGKRRTLGNLLIWWMLVPLILLAVFSISRMDYGDVAGELRMLVQVTGEGVKTGGFADNGNVFGTAWMIVAVMSSFELVLFSFARTRKNERRPGIDLIRVAVWMVAAVVLSYVYILGMLGSRYVESGIRLSLGNKLDYVLAMPWLIGSFFVTSSYVFYAKEMMLVFADDDIALNGGYADKGESGLAEQGMPRGERQRAVYFKTLMYGLIFTGSLFFVCCFHYDVVRPYMVNWLVYGDVALSLILPGILMLVSSEKNSVTRREHH